MSQFLSCTKNNSLFFELNCNRLNRLGSDCSSVNRILNGFFYVCEYLIAVWNAVYEKFLPHLVISFLSNFFRG